MRVGVIGCGFFARNHLAAWADMEGVTLAGVCDLDPAKAASAASDFRAERAYADAAEMLDTAKLDFVDIATQMDSHAFLVGLAVDRGIPTIVQKPLAPTWEASVAIVEKARAAGVPLMVHENTRFQTPVRRAREVLDSGRIGTLNWARVSFRTGHDIYGKQPYLADAENFVLLDLGVHMLDVARYLMGEVESLYCQTRTVKQGIRGEDMATTMLRHEGGATSIVECSYASPIHPDPFPEMTLHIEGSKGSISLTPPYRMSVFADGRAESIDVEPAMFDWSEKPWHGAQESVARIQRHWVDCMRAGRTPETSGADSLKTYGLVFGAYRSARFGQPVVPFDREPANG
ncbi:MAG: Gfo/Idh/MocA family oxidoreductase [Rhizobiaceae bacterium]|nr:Gfo/Idh/MocA family oxidoreductase [Rhizobiaceae bacterium]